MKRELLNQENIVITLWRELYFKMSLYMRVIKLRSELYSSERLHYEVRIIFERERVI